MRGFFLYEGKSAKVKYYRKLLLRTERIHNSKTTAILEVPLSVTPTWEDYMKKAGKSLLFLKAYNYYYYVFF